jgi:hypothetical protein
MITDRFPISGWVAAGFEPVRAAFEANFARRGEVRWGLLFMFDGEEQDGFEGDMRFDQPMSGEL